jgi:hypothetical protein
MKLLISTLSLQVGLTLHKKGEVLLPQILQVHDLQTCTLNKTLPTATIQPSFDQLNQKRTWATPSPSGYQDQMMYSRMTELIKQEEQ